MLQVGDRDVDGIVSLLEADVVGDNLETGLQDTDALAVTLAAAQILDPLLRIEHVIATIGELATGLTETAGLDERLMQTLLDFRKSVLPRMQQQLIVEVRQQLACRRSYLFPHMVLFLQNSFAFLPKYRPAADTSSVAPILNQVYLFSFSATSIFCCEARWSIYSRCSCSMNRLFSSS